MTPEAESEAAQLRARLMVAMLTPILVLLGAGGLLAYQIQALNRNTLRVDRADAVIATTYEVLRGILDQETAVRGFMLSEDQTFLTPYRQAAPEETLDELYLLVRDEFQCLIAAGADEGMGLAQRFLPSAIILDLGLPDHSGLSLLDRLKHSPSTRHIPVQ